MTISELIEKLETKIKKSEEENQRLLRIIIGMSDSQKKLLEEYDKVIEGGDKLVTTQQTEIQALQAEIASCKEKLIQRFIDQKIKLQDIPNEPLTIGMVQGIFSQAPFDFILNELRVLERRMTGYKIKRRIKNARDFTWSRINKFF